MNPLHRNRVESLIASMPNPPDIATGLFIPLEDVIIISEFADDVEYYAILLHEIAHASGHPSRLGRYTIGEDGIYRSTVVSDDKVEVFEDTVAEICAALLAASIHIINLTHRMHEEKIADYKAELADSSLLKLAIQQALEAAQYITGKKVSIGILPYSIKRLL